ncbi:hypothetical protein [Deinococcus multiflagellatus]|uniref:Uncharacterized protein n=1 Tax=Deinococcus multiflagellatus TaxID=1656887 RepID=A0ABW1ZL11_9DEIO|nr:hypothetical protein [Deinococcus multiflagellatus]MBZ9713098.1 hypothetical protein [Deinococcus multiflagellatus]
MTPRPAPRVFPPATQLYHEAVVQARAGHLAQACALLARAYTLTPPQALSPGEGLALLPLQDDLVFLGQFLPCLRPTLALVQTVGRCTPPTAITHAS